MPSSSNGIFIAVNDETQSTMNCTSGYFFNTAAISQSGFIVPVLVSLWISVTASNSPVASFASMSAARIGWPHSTCSASACLPHFLATSNHLSENAPLMQVRTFFETKLRIDPSITPQAELVLTNTGCLV